ALPDVILRRARHVVREIARVAAVMPLAADGDAAALGGAMLASHASGRDLYQVSCAELDAMVEIASAIDGCHGARLTGAGFGGCTVNLVARGRAADFRLELARAYERRIGLRPEVWICEAADGVEVIDPDQRRRSTATS
ncbi:MAG: galactokinase, partial [Candidatus Binatia bacterium]